LASKIKGVNLLCAHGRAGQTQLPFWRRISLCEIRKITAALLSFLKQRPRLLLATAQLLVF